MAARTSCPACAVGVSTAAVTAADIRAVVTDAVIDAGNVVGACVVNAKVDAVVGSGSGRSVILNRPSASTAMMSSRRCSATLGSPGPHDSYRDSSGSGTPEYRHVTSVTLGGSCELSDKRTFSQKFLAQPRLVDAFQAIWR